MERVARRFRTRGVPEDVSHSKAVIDGAKDAELFIAQARWLLEFHNKRSDAFAARAVAMLGFSGVILALLPRALDLEKIVKPTAGFKISVAVMTVALLAAVGCCVAVLAPRQTSTASVEGLRKSWRLHLKGERLGKASRDLADSMLHGGSVTASSPVDSAYAEASVRGKWFKWSTRFLAIAIAGLAAIILQVYWQLGR